MPPGAKSKAPPSPKPLEEETKPENNPTKVTIPKSKKRGSVSEVSSDSQAASSGQPSASSSQPSSKTDSTIRAYIEEKRNEGRTLEEIGNELMKVAAESNSAEVKKAALAWIKKMDQEFPDSA